MATEEPDMTADNKLTRHPNDESMKEAMWMYQQGYFKGLMEHGAQKALGGADRIKEATTCSRDRSLGCIDPRVLRIDFHLAGSGILASLNKTVEAVKKANIQVVYSHKDCGAATQHAASKGIVDPREIEEIAETWSRHVADEAGIEYGGHLDPTEFKQPLHLLPARVVYYSGVAFDPHKATILPGFVASPVLGKDLAQKDVVLATHLAFDSTKGFGNRFTEQNPLYMIAVSDSSTGSLGTCALRDELRDIRNRAFPNLPIKVDMLDVSQIA